MASRQPLYAGPVLLALLAAAGCSGAGTSPLAPTAPVASQGMASTHSRPIGTAAKNFVYVADAYSDAVWIFPASAGSNPVGSITSGVGGPQGLAVDASGTLYVANPAKATVTIYPAGSTTPSLTLSQDLTVPTAVAVDKRGNVWVSNEEGGDTGSVVEFPAGKTTPSTVISGLNPLGIAVDSRRNLYVENYNTTAAFVSVYPPGATKPSKQFGQGVLLEPLGITIGPTGDIYVCDYYYNDVFIFSHKGFNLRKKVFVQEGSLAAALSPTDRLYVVTGSQAVISAIKRDGFGKVINQWYPQDQQSAFGVAADPAVAPGP